MAIFAPRLAELSERDRQTLESLSRAMMDQVARQPIATAERRSRSAGSTESGEARDLIYATRELFGLDASPRESAPQPKPDGPEPIDLLPLEIRSGGNRMNAPFVVLSVVALALYVAAAVCHGADLFLTAPAAPAAPASLTSARLALLGRVLLALGRVDAGCGDRSLVRANAYVAVCR